jgi:G3E family GTPase
MPPDFFLLAGSLGSGKTTLLLDYLASGAASETGIIVNDVGAINIDGAVIRAAGNGLDLATLEDGCVCCSLGNDLLYTMEALFAERAASGRGDFRRIILECSGLSRPGRIIRSLGGLAAAGMRLAVLATYDCSRDPLTGSLFDDAAAQLAAAHTIILTKPDRVDAAAIAAARKATGGINPLASLIHDTDRGKRAARAFTMPDAPIGLTADIPGPVHPRIETFLARLPHPPAWPDLCDWLENLAGLCGDRLLRVKGLVRIADCPDTLLLQAVGSTFDAPRLMPGLAAGENALVIIARDLGIDELRDLAPDLGLAISSNRTPALLCT